MANNKITKKEMFTEILALVKDNKAMVDFINHEIELLDKKKASGSKKAQENKSANSKLANELYVALGEIGRPVTITEFQKETPYENLFCLSNQKISSLLRILITDGLVIRTEEKKKAYFSVVETDEEVGEEVEE